MLAYSLGKTANVIILQQTFLDVINLFGNSEGNSDRNFPLFIFNPNLTNSFHYVLKSSQILARKGINQLPVIIILVNTRVLAVRTQP